MALSGPPPLMAAGVLLYRDSFNVRSFDYITGGIAVVLSRRQHTGERND
jgi:hypothetical protein